MSSAGYPNRITPPTQPSTLPSGPIDDHRLPETMSFAGCPNRITPPRPLTILPSAPIDNHRLRPHIFSSDSGPHNPKFQIVDAAVTSSNTSIDGGVYITGRWNVTLLAKNPNTITPISYMNFRATLLYDSFHDGAVSTTPSHTFSPLSPAEETRVAMQFASTKPFNIDKNDDLMSREEFKVMIFVRLKFDSFDEHEEEKMFIYECSPIRMTYFTNVSSTPYVRNCDFLTLY
ncbi:protein YLS9-like [Senna tora]|uniref:Protein YLS9-like n=1 Tax=Senna tora TaxID=362788 RepID=A0A834WWH8_9FABA|nr:protein YLS9-like [Senna tora]